MYPVFPKIEALFRCEGGFSPLHDHLEFLPTAKSFPSTLMRAATEGVVMIVRRVMKQISPPHRCQRAHMENRWIGTDFALRWKPTLLDGSRCQIRLDVEVLHLQAMHHNLCVIHICMLELNLINRQLLEAHIPFHCKS